MTTAITASELARSLADILNRAAYQGETFEIERGGRRLVLKLEERSSNLRTIRDALFAHRARFADVDAELSDDVVRGRNALNTLPEPGDPWAR
ncbi:MAG TPA: hypothetical protein VI299_02590 [Polyangiales bacterium]